MTVNIRRERSRGMKDGSQSVKNLFDDIRFRIMNPVYLANDFIHRIRDIERFNPGLSVLDGENTCAGDIPIPCRTAERTDIDIQPVTPADVPVMIMPIQYDIAVHTGKHVLQVCFGGISF